ncbi:hypothetical protein [Bradyrhizobium tropiciagri]|uniref:hypothetical protein n=1 Tax=Bradyrhizobium tropiciagri TaxID=312253 RepID=UPI00067DF0B0|nr:hypothetical protein [Bradyrhizobium tropiciagri]
MAERPLFYVDFNELMERDVVLLSQTDIKQDVDGNDIELVEGLPIAIYSDDIGASGEPDNLVAEGVVIRNRYTVHFPHVKWCCRIGPEGIRHQSDLTL